MRNLLTVVLALAGAGVMAQTPTAPAFEAVSIKRSESLSTGGGLAPRGGVVTGTNMSISGLISWSYGLRSNQLIAGPDWLRAERYNLVARAAENTPVPQLRLMMRAVLADRFKFEAHPDKRELPGYRLVVARPGRLGPDMREGAPCTPGTPRTGGPCQFSDDAGAMTAAGMSMRTLADFLAVPTGSIVADATGLSGVYDFTLRWTPEFDRRAGEPGAAAPVTDAPTIFAAVQEQLGLRLEPSRVPVDVLVIDAIERPRDN